METNYTFLFILLFVGVVVFLVCRELLCWYWKINKSIANQEQMISLLQQLVNENKSSPTYDDNTTNNEAKYKNYVGYTVDIIQYNGLKLTGEVVASCEPDEYLYLNTGKGTLKIKLDVIKHIKTV